ncbi:L-shaped tail fiber protein [Klebsiella phage DP]|uniref:L-shaped tail fiber protein n=1 Tax=Klebsiella phage vB_KpnM_BIS47 TaxID=1907784 RepID=A0A1V0E6N2_9CAUD|nr:tail protein [Klebsiella phage vB_KpnM_BIS47]ARB12530.1 L-shaped tail fiber protein [Klebsiella phage vB_KpnM_BIS47]UYA58167.1 L-shaped tail fiber protein [Klebsiella phage DP]
MATTDIPIIKIKNLNDKELVSDTDEIIIQSSLDTEKTTIRKFITDIGILKRGEVTGITGASLIGTHSGATVQQVLDSLSNSWQNLYYFSTTGNEIGSHVDTISISPVQRTYGVQISTPSASFSPKTDNVLSNGTTSLRWSQVYAVNSVISTSNKKKKTNLRQITPTEAKAFYEIGKLDSVWQWLSKYSSEKGAARLHSGPTVQDAIKVMLKYGLDWTKYSAFCYDSWEANGNTPAGEEFAFRKEELLFWILRATIVIQEDLDKRLSVLEDSLSGN